MNCDREIRNVKKSALLTLCLFATATAFAQTYPSENPFAESPGIAHADLDGTGTANYIVAVSDDRVRVLKTGGGTATVVAEAAPDTMIGSFPQLRLVDLDGDGRPEIVASYPTPRASQSTWIFHWTGRGLTNIGPTVTAGPRHITHSILGLVEFFDVDGDGIPEPVEFDREDIRIWKRSSDGAFKVVRNQVAYINRYQRQTAEPELFSGVFNATPGQLLEVIVIVGKGVTGGDVHVNGHLVFGPSDLKKPTRLLKRTIKTEAVNEVESTVDGKPGAAIVVMLAPPQ